MIHASISHLAVPIGSLNPHPDNPRRGDVEVIKESLTVNGQYKPVLVQASTRFILGGNHTWLAARRLGWTEVAALIVDVDDEMATRILISDNRHSDLGTDDVHALTELLQAMPELEGTGFGQDDLDRMLRDLDRPLSYDPPAPDPAGSGSGDGSGDGDDDAGDPVPPLAVVDAPDFTVQLTPGSLVDWAKDFKGKKGTEKLRTLVSWPDDSGPPKLSDIGAITRVGSGAEDTEGVGERVPVDDLTPHPLNPRQGDVGAIAESLTAIGQYRPLTVNRGTHPGWTGAPNTILGGNHTYFAARSLGWKTVGVTYVDVDDHEAARILVIDNKAAELGTYNAELLAESLQGLDGLAGTGYDFDDLDELLASTAASPEAVARKGKAKLRIIDEDSAVALSLATKWPLYDSWYADLEARASTAGTDPSGLICDLLSLASARAAADA